MFSFTKQHRFLVLLLFILMIPNIVLVVVGEDSVVISSIKKIAFLAFSTAFIIFPLLILRPKFYAFLMLFLSFFIVFETYVIVHYKAPSSEEIVGALFYTNTREAMEFLKSSLLYLILFIAVLLSQVFLFLKMKKEFKLPRSQKLFIFFYVLSVLSVFFIRDYRFASNFSLGQGTFEEKMGHAHYLFMHKVHKIFPVSFYPKINNVRKGIKKINLYNQTVKGFK